MAAIGFYTVSSSTDRSDLEKFLEESLEIPSIDFDIIKW